MANKTKTERELEKEGKQVIAIVNGLTIKTSSLYKIEPKLDKSAPDGFIKAGTTKLQSMGIGNSTPCRWEERENGQGKYDTGFYTGSPCYVGTSPADQKAIVASLQKYIVEPYEAITATGTLDVSNKEFWDGYTVDLYEGKVFNTDNIDDLLGLYIAVRSFDLCPAGQEGSPSFSTADYVIKDNEYSMSVNQQRSVAKFEAINGFMTLINLEKNNLYAILRSLNVIAMNHKSPDSDLISSFHLWLDKDVQNAEFFLKAYKKSQDPAGMEEILLTVQIKKLIDRKVLKKEGNEYVYKGEPLGIDSKSIVAKLQKDTELEKLKDELRVM